MNQKLDFLKQLARGIAAQFGASCEVVIHDLNCDDIEQSIVHIENGHVSNRQIGGGASGVVLEARRADPKTLKDRAPYTTKTSDGRRLRSSTLYIRNEKGGVDYIFSINYDITPLLAIEKSIRSLARVEDDEAAKQEVPQTQPQITNNVAELLDILIAQAVAHAGKPVEQMNKNDKAAVVKYLEKAGAFLITKSGDKVSSLLGISKFTLYNYMEK